MDSSHSSTKGSPSLAGRCWANEPGARFFQLFGKNSLRFAATSIAERWCTWKKESPKKKVIILFQKMQRVCIFENNWDPKILHTVFHFEIPAHME